MAKKVVKTLTGDKLQLTLAIAKQMASTASYEDIIMKKKIVVAGVILILFVEIKGHLFKRMARLVIDLRMNSLTRKPSGDHRSIIERQPTYYKY